MDGWMENVFSGFQANFSFSFSLSCLNTGTTGGLHKERIRTIKNQIIIRRSVPISSTWLTWHIQMIPLKTCSIHIPYNSLATPITHANQLAVLISAHVANSIQLNFWAELVLVNYGSKLHAIIYVWYHELHHYSLTIAHIIPVLILQMLVG